MDGTDRRIYRYVVRYDGGTAPRPFGRVCSLAICKPRIRAAAEPGDWIIGFRSRHPGYVVYAMQVSERMPQGEYWQDSRFAARKPGRSPCPDNIYQPGAEGLEQMPNDVHVPEDAPRDISGKFVLIACRFWYFGRYAVPLPNHLMHLVHTTQGHVVHKNRRPDDCAELTAWLATWPVGIHGMPIDREVDLGDMSRDVKSANKLRCGRPGTAAMTTDPVLPESKEGTSRAGSCGAGRKKRALLVRNDIARRRLVLSRKGFDSGYGGMPSPILPDGRLLPLPIPASHDAFKLDDINADGVNLAALVNDLSKGRHSLETSVHLDPDLNRKPELQMPGWRPSLGQSGNAQSHLNEQGIGPGDIFLFFGWFRQVEQRVGRWRFAAGARDLHVLFGWLEVDELLPIAIHRDQCLALHPWIADHPHTANPGHYSDPRNVIYVAPQSSGRVPGRPGGGVFRRYSELLRLTADEGSRSVWTLPKWFHPRARRTPLTYHAKPERWSLGSTTCGLRSVAKGQEFVLDIGDCDEAGDWIERLICSA